MISHLFENHDGVVWFTDDLETRESPLVVRGWSDALDLIARGHMLLGIHNTREGSASIPYLELLLSLRAVPPGNSDPNSLWYARRFVLDVLWRVYREARSFGFWSEAGDGYEFISASPAETLTTTEHAVSKQVTLWDGVVFLEEEKFINSRKTHCLGCERDTQSFVVPTLCSAAVARASFCDDCKLPKSKPEPLMAGAESHLPIDVKVNHEYMTAWTEGYLPGPPETVVHTGCKIAAGDNMIRYHCETLDGGVAWEVYECLCGRERQLKFKTA